MSDVDMPEASDEELEELFGEKIESSDGEDGDEDADEDGRDEAEALAGEVDDARLLVALEHLDGQISPIKLYLG